ncbi:UDP-N-acetylmuramoyl-tripeptide--D-alanyl-D-alanine ligase [Ruminococcus sp. OA3]|uniref:UDP-N-acetylmuramoyl-tripeptide--D-alanyl-D- alanine ligase n=1 Tax=Ruminococcus sp. OA3 TaxID=2914164 RepID=UPI001F058A28|nr:UDP-N-acetylmuramoyl-tripeptide--D-alanyl-D-alanine ligase [Ruminococcus sp. OA3]MCH1981345.1 UDP-N-acetylmuramoyl-tripeptide--D-alanyl-D-alanine ligase [Ruminococcus sp. OA3]
MKNLTLKNIAAACGGVFHGDAALLGQCAESITTDSRQAEPGCLFVPIAGARADGHHYIGQVMEKGALCTLSEKELPDADFPYIHVESSLQSVKDIAEFYLRQLDIPVVGISGSVGKTSTKEMISSVLSQKYHVLKTQGNFNNELGLPLTVFRIREEDQIAVLEMGISDFGEMSRLAKIARPDTCVLTNIGWCHLENLKTRDGIMKAKTEMFEFMQPDGHVVLNGDDDKLAQIQDVRGHAPVFFGVEKQDGVYADEIENCGLKGISCRIHVDEKLSFPVKVPTPGIHMVYNALAAACVGRIYGLTAEEIKTGIESMETLSGRFHIIESDDYTIIDDCYNANPVSMMASLEVLQQGLGRKVAVLGDMGELGDDEAALHEQVGTFAGQCDIQLLICAGPLCEHLAKAAREQNKELKVLHFADRKMLQDALPGLIKKGDTLLIKASHFMQFDKIVKQFSSSDG